MIDSIIGFVDVCIMFFRSNVDKFINFIAGITAAIMFSLMSTASAQDIDGIVTAATGGIDKVKAAVISIAVVVVTIALARWAASKVKPRG